METNTEIMLPKVKTNGINNNVNLVVERATLYYGVYVPREDANSTESKDEMHVYSDRTEAMNVVKKYKKSRFKTFKTRAEACAFAAHGNEQELVAENRAEATKSAASEEKCSNFKAPGPQEMHRFRKFIEAGDLASVKQIVWENPRCLVSSGDTPLVLKEGPRYNALHIAVRESCKPDMIQLILNTVGNPEFVKLLDGDKGSANYLDRAQIFVDLYLNTPDKGLNETPLHFATKYGLKDIVQVLVSYPQCLKMPRNKHGQTPADIICDRKCQDDGNLKREILALLDEQYYVPVLRSEDNTIQPLIGDPFSPTRPPQLNIDPISPRIEVRAIAGPMSKDQATEFRKKWKTPPRLQKFRNCRDDSSLADSFTMNSPLMNMTYRLQDTEKGLERVGRDLAKEYHVPWKEYWPFLDTFADFTSDEGLAQLEKFLAKQFDYLTQSSIQETGARDVPQIGGSDTCEEINDLCQTFSRTLRDIVTNNAENDIISVQRRLFNDINDNDENTDFYTPPSSPTSSIYSSDDEDNMFLAEEGPMIFIKGQFVSNLDHAVYQAISCVDIDPETYPYVYRWRHQLQLVLSQDSMSSTVTNFRIDGTPAKTRTRLFASPSPTLNYVKRLNY